MDNNESQLSKFETLFWKVIHNKYIFKKIFHIIETVNWVEIKECSQIGNPNYRIKFKDIQSIEWMITNKQYQLLIYKLRYCEKLIKSNSINAHCGDNYIEINDGDIHSLLKLGVADVIGDYYGDGIDESKQQQKQLVNEKLILLEILPLILNNKKLEIGNMNLIRMSIYNNNITALQILLNEPYSFQMYPSDLELSIQYSSVSLVSYIIGLPNVIIYPSTKSNSIELAFKNKFHRNEMLKLILDNEKLYNSPSITITTTTTTTTPTTSSSQVDNNNGIDTTTYKKLKTLSLFKIKSSEIQNKLLDLHYFKKIEGESNNIKGLNQLLSKLSFERLSNSINKILDITNENGNGIDRAKEIHKLLAIESNEYYNSYLTRYDEPINGVDLMALIKHCLSTFSINSLSYLLSNDPFCIDYLNEYKIEINCISVDSSPNTKSPTIEFIKLYLSNISKFDNEQCNESIDNYILNIGSSKQYEIILNEISNCSDNKYPSKWNSILSINNKKDIIITKETIDYLIEFHSNQFIQEIIYESKFGKRFKSFELVEYTIHSYIGYDYDACYSTVIKSNLKKMIGNMFKNSIKLCETQMLNGIKKFKSLFKDFTFFAEFMPQINSITSQPIDNIIKLFNYFESIDYQCFTKDLLMELIRSLSLNANINNLDEINLLPTSLPLKKFIYETINEFMSTINDPSPIKMKLILNNFNPISTTEFNDQWYIDNSFRALYNSKCQIILPFTNKKRDDTIQCIEILFNHLNQEINLVSNDGKGYMNLINIQMYSSIVNHLFERLISTEYVKPDTIKQVFKMVNQTNDIIKLKQINNQHQQPTIVIQHSIYHSFFYICIKSVYFQKYLMNLPFIIDPIDDGDYNVYYSEMSYVTNGYDIAKYLDPTIFTFEYLFGNDDGGASFDQVLVKLVHHLSRLPATINNRQLIIEKPDYYNTSLNSDLIYYLSIKRTDLFFRLLDEIQQQLNDPSFIIGYFPTKIKNAKVNNDKGNETELYQQTITNGRIFKFTQNLFNLASKLFEESELEFQKFISFCSYYSVVDCLVNPSKLYINDHYLNHFNQYKSIINTHYQGGEGGNNYQFFNNEPGSKFGVSIDHLIKYQNYFITKGSNNIIGVDKLDEKLKFSSHYGYTNHFNLVLRDLLSKHFKYSELPNYFNVTKLMIDHTIRFGHIGFLKYYYENNDNNNNDYQLILKQYIKDNLLLNSNYKYSNWLTKQ